MHESWGSYGWQFAWIHIFSTGFSTSFADRGKVLCIATPWSVWSCQTPRGQLNGKFYEIRLETHLRVRLEMFGIIRKMVSECFRCFWFDISFFDTLEIQNHGRDWLNHKLITFNDFPSDVWPEAPGALTNSMGIPAGSCNTTWSAGTFGNRFSTCLNALVGCLCTRSLGRMRLNRTSIVALQTCL